MIPSDVPPAVADGGAYLAVAVAAATLLVMLWVWIGRPVRREWKLNRSFQRQFRSDWLGEPPRDGVPGRPGVMIRLADMAADGMHLSERVRKLERDLLKIRSEVTFLLTHRCPDSTAGVQPPEDQEG